MKNPRSTIGLEIRSQSVFPAFRTLLPSANLSAEQSVCDSPLQIVIAALLTFIFLFEVHQTAIIVSGGAPTPDPASSNSKKCAKLSLLSAEGFQTRLNGHHCHLRTYHSFFSRAGKPSEDITSC